MMRRYLALMRTTVTIDDHLLAEAKALAARTGRPLGAVVDDALRVLLVERAATRAPVNLPTSGGSGLQPGDDPSTPPDGPGLTPAVRSSASSSRGAPAVDHARPGQGGEGQRPNGPPRDAPETAVTAEVRAVHGPAGAVAVVDPGRRQHEGGDDKEQREHGERRPLGHTSMPGWSRTAAMRARPAVLRQMYACTS